MTPLPFWKSIGVLAAQDAERLRLKRDLALAMGNSEAGETYHKAMMTAEIDRALGERGDE